MDLKVSSTESTTKSISDLFTELKTRWAACDCCKFSTWRKHMIWGRGKLDSRVVIAGDCPGRIEDFHGEPFMGTTGQILEISLNEIGLFSTGEKANCFVTNVLACRPSFSAESKNCLASYENILSCRPRIEQMLDILQPNILVLVGKVARSLILGHEEIKQTCFHDCRIFCGMGPNAQVYQSHLTSEWNSFWLLVKGAMTQKTHVNNSAIDWQLPIFGDTGAHVQPESRNAACLPFAESECGRIKKVSSLPCDAGHVSYLRGTV